MSNLVPIERIEKKIFLIRGQKVILDRDLAELYGVETKVLNQAVKRNISRFPEDFMFQLTKEEYKNVRFQFGTSHLKSQFVTSRWGGRRKLPYAFTEHGIAMLSSVLNSERAIQANILIIRTFIRLRQILAKHKDLAQKFSRLKEKFDRGYKKHDIEIQAIFITIKKLIDPPKSPKRKIGFLR